MAKRTGISLVSTDGGLMVWKLGDGSSYELNTNKFASNVREAAFFAGVHRAISNIGAGKDKENWPAILREMSRRGRGMVAGQWKVNVGGYGFADHVEAIVRLAMAEGKSVSHETISDMLLAKTPEQRSAHAAIPRVRLAMQEIQTERMRNAVAEDDVMDSILNDLFKGL